MKHIKTDLTLNDIQLMLNVIKTVAQRGAFETKEFAVVGNLSDKLETIIAEIQASAQHSAEAQTEALEETRKQLQEGEAKSEQLELPFNDQ